MKSTRKIVALSLAAVLAAPPVVLAQHVPPSPCPCTVDGGCYPKRNTWGHYGTRWRPWPGVDFSDAQAGQKGTSVLEKYNVPRPEDEERQSPPPLETDRKESETSEQPSIDTPPLNLPTLPLQPLPPATPPGPPTPEGGAPPSLPPFLQPTTPTGPGTFRPQPGTDPTTPNPGGDPPRPATVPLGPPGSFAPPAGLQRPATANEQDAPPALPLHFTQRSSVAPAMAAAEARRLPASPAASGIVPASATVAPGVRHQAQPAVYAPANDPPPALPAFDR